MTELHVVVPAAVADPGRPSGGNVYDRRVCAELVGLGWTLHEHLVPGDWPQPDDVALAGLAATLSHLPDGASVLVDGLLASGADHVVVPAAARLRLVVLLHMPLGALDGDGVLDHAGVRERWVLAAASGVIVTSDWARRRLADLYGPAAARVHVATPGVDPGDLAEGSKPGGVLLCVAAVVPAKGHDLLLGALARVADLSWRCICVGALDLDPAHVGSLRQQAETSSIEERVHFAGVMGRDELARAFLGADLLVLPSRTETYGMVVTEALSHALPVVATDVGGVREALGDEGAGPAGILVAPGDEAALAGALRSWLEDPRLRTRLRAAARERRLTLAEWDATGRSVAAALMHEPDRDGIRVPRAGP
ncbi:MAG TPA: glycosyltransferase family 4 protein [Pedococcus sp.]|nr:glycosyltransferase family 4 protein [Pedococcus sp.]